MAFQITSEHSDDRSALASCRDPVCRVVRTEGAGSVKRGISVASDLMGISYERARAYWHNEVRRPTAAELLRIRRAYRRWVWDRQLKLASEIEQLRAELQELGGHE
jgi:hypothetical protein